MLIRPGECTQCQAQYHLPADFGEPLVRCRLCPGAVKVGEPIDVPDEAPPAAKGRAGRAGRVGVAAAPVAAATTEVPTNVEATPAPTVGEAAAQLASAVLSNVDAAVERASAELHKAGAAAEQAVEAATPSAFGISGDVDSTAARTLASVREIEARTHEIEEELELLELDEEPLAPAAGPSDRVGASGGSPSAGWSPAALERGGSTLEPQPSRRSGGTLERLKAERAAAAASTPAAESTPLAKRPSTLERLKAERAAAAAAAPSTPGPAESKPLSTLERLKAERAGAAKPAPAAQGAAAAKPLSTLERLKAERAAATAPASAPAPATAANTRRERNEGARGKGRREEREPRALGFSREEQRKRTMRLSLIGFGSLVLILAVLGVLWKQGYFDPPAAPVPAAPAEVAPVDTPAPVVPTGPNPFDQVLGAAGAASADPAANGTPAEGAAAPDAADGADGGDSPDDASEGGTSLEDEARSRIGGGG